MAEKTKLGERVTLHHPKLSKQIVRTRRQAKVLAKAGWKEGALPGSGGNTGTTSGGK